MSPTTITLRFNPETLSFKGNGGCNDFYGQYSAQVAQNKPEYTVYNFKFNNIGHTRIQCPDNQMKTESRLLTLLPKINSCHIDAYTLIFYHNNKEIIRLER